MERITVWLSPDLMEVLKRKARTQKISLSHCAKEFIKKGLLQNPLAEEKSVDLSATPKIDRYLLKNGIEAILLLRRLLPEKDRPFIPQATETSKEVVRQLLDHKNLTDEK